MVLVDCHFQSALESTTACRSATECLEQRVILFEIDVIPPKTIFVRSVGLIGSVGYIKEARSRRGPES